MSSELKSWTTKSFCSLIGYNQLERIISSPSFKIWSQPISQFRLISYHRLEQLNINHLLSIYVSNTVLSDY